jgi:hypothetical protein
MRAQKMSRDIRKRLNVNCIPTLIQVTEIYHRGMMKRYEKIYIPENYSNAVKPMKRWTDQKRC